MVPMSQHQNFDMYKKWRWFFFHSGIKQTSGTSSSSSLTWLYIIITIIIAFCLVFYLSKSLNFHDML